MSNVYEWLNKDKLRYYKITIDKLPDNIQLNYVWGGCNSSRGGQKKLVVKSDKEVEHYISAMIKRRKSRGYELITPSSIM